MILSWNYGAKLPLVPQSPKSRPKLLKDLRSRCRPRRFKWSSFTHHIHLDSTQFDEAQLEAANRPVPCKYKGICEFSESFAEDKVKA